MRVIKGLVFLDNHLAYRGKWLWHQSYSTLGSGTWHWFLLYNIIRIVSKIKRLTTEITRWFQNKSNIVRILLALGTLAVMFLLASLVSAAETHFETVIKTCNSALLEQNWEVWAACNSLSVDETKAAMLMLRGQTQDMVASEFQGQLKDFKYETYKILSVLNNTEGLVIHSITITFERNNSSFSLTLQALLRAEVEPDGWALRLQILRMNMGEPVLIGSKL